MLDLKRCLVATVLLAVLLAFPRMTHAGKPSAEARARAALALALATQKAKPEAGDCGCGGLLPCPCGDNCTCGVTSKASVKATVKAPPAPIENLEYQIAYQRAVRQNKPLLIWVGETCPSCEQNWTAYVHARCTEYDWPNYQYKGPGVIVARPDGLGGMSRVTTLDNIPALASVQAVLGQQATARRTTCVCPDGTVCDCPGGICPPQCLTPRAAPQFFAAPPMMPMMGGFGGGFGGFGGGGCGGGGCSGGG